MRERIDRDPADLTSTVLDEEARRRESEAERSREVVLPDDLLPGVGEKSMGMREVLRRGGVSTIAVLGLLNLVDEFDRVAVAVLAPDIQQTLGISDTLLAVLGTLGGVLVVLAALPIGYLADRMKRTWLIGGVGTILGVSTMATAFIGASWQFALTRIGAGFGKGGTPAHNAVLADAYPIGGRGRIFAMFNMANPFGLLVGPALAGGIAALAGGAEGWRWAFIVVALPTLVLSILAFAVREPRRGKHEQEAVFGSEGEVLGDTDIPLAAAFERLKKIRTFYFILIGLCVMGFGLFSFQIFFSLFLEDQFGLDAFSRGLVQSFTAVGGVAGGVTGGVVADRLFRRDPARAIVATACLLFAFVFGPIAMYMPTVPLVTLVASVSQFGITGALTGLVAIIASVVPFRLRGQGYAMVGVYMFFFGAFFGAIVTGQLSDAMGERAALSIVVPPALALGAVLMSYGARFVRGDISNVVSELREEQEEARVRKGGMEVPVLQVRQLDFSYGHVQVLFDVGFDVYRGETLALVGTNGAGKSTVLRAVSGLGLPDRGVIRLNGKMVTYADAERRVDKGIVEVPGGKAVFRSLSVWENLVAGAYQYVWDWEEVEKRIGYVMEVFPALESRLDQQAGTLSGGEQQMLALGKGLLLEPEVLLIDELSLGLAPVVVEDLLGVVDRLRGEGLTMVIVEQSMNIAMSIADRAVFMEKGRVRFEGRAKDLKGRDDLARAVFMSGEGG